MWILHEIYFYYKIYVPVKFVECQNYLFLCYFLLSRILNHFIYSYHYSALYENLMLEQLQGNYQYYKPLLSY